MTQLPFRDLAQLKIAEDFLILADLRWDFEDLLSDLKPMGLWWLMPIARTYARDILAVRVGPVLPIENSPIVLIASSFGNVVTLASSPAELLSVLLFETPGNKLSWKALAGLPTNGWAELGRLHRALGGRDAGWVETRRIALNADLREACSGDDVKPGQRYDAITGLQSQLDPGSAAFRRFVLEARASNQAPVPTPHCGAFQPAASSVAFSVNDSEENRDLARAAALAILESPPNLDASALGGHPSAFPSVAVQAMKTYRRAARYVTDDPLYGSVATQIRDESYSSGEAHLRLTADLIKARRYERAYAALISAAYFPDANDEAFRSALALARSQKWANVISTLESWMAVEADS